MKNRKLNQITGEEKDFDVYKNDDGYFIFLIIIFVAVGLNHIFA